MSRHPMYDPLASSDSVVSLTECPFVGNSGRTLRHGCQCRARRPQAWRAPPAPATRCMACSTRPSEYSPSSVTVAVSIISGASFVAMSMSSPGTNPIWPVVAVSHRVLPRAPTLPLPTANDDDGELLNRKPAHVVPLASARQHPENQKESQAGHSPERDDGELIKPRLRASS